MFGSRNDYRLALLVNSQEKMTIDTSGNVGIGTITPDPSYKLHVVGSGFADGGSFVDGSSREFKEEIRELGVDEARFALLALEPVRYRYKASAGEERVGFIAEDVPELLAMNDRKGLSSMDIVAVLTKIVQEQRLTIGQLEAHNSDLDARLEALEEMVAALRLQ